MFSFSFFIIDNKFVETGGFPRLQGLVPKNLTVFGIVERLDTISGIICLADLRYISKCIQNIIAIFGSIHKEPLNEIVNPLQI